MLKFIVERQDGAVLSHAQGENEVWLVHEGEYLPGDLLALECLKPEAWVFVRLDHAIGEALVYVRDGRCSFPVPFGQARKIYPPQAFTGSRHYLYARLAAGQEIAVRRNMALNPMSLHTFSGIYPFASANVETRGESVFAAGNAIDGYKANSFHGEWPYTSWGINCDPEAAWRLDFGRPVVLDEVVVYLRADFPHDAWWESAVLHFSDGSDLRLAFKKTAYAQRFAIRKRKVEWVVLDTLIKADDPSPFPALTQIEFWGMEAFAVK